jgi:thymidylate synthase
LSNTLPLLVKSQNLSQAWAEAFIHLIDNEGKEISPLVVSISDFVDDIAQEDNNVRNELDRCLDAIDEQQVHTVANTIFAPSLWRLAKYNRQRLYQIYKKTLPRYKALAPSKNSRGDYFERLIAFGSGPHNGNQLEHIITEYKSRNGVRRSMFQASIFDPARDHVRLAQLPFPCLQHLSFVPQGDSLIINAFYATQLLLEKAYGNYLGLCRLGHFMAYEMGLKLGRMNCFTGIEKLDRIGKSSPLLKSLIKVSRAALNES